LSDRELTDREVGRIQFRGPSSTSGYYRNAQATQELFHGEWLDTGDLGYLVKGELYITGRAKDMIIRSGRHIFPYELEESVGSLKEVRKGGVAVFGKNDPLSGVEKLIVLAEIREPGAATDALKTKVRDLVVASIGIPPDDIVLAPPHAVLKTPSGKIRRAECLRLYEMGALGKTVPLWRQWVRLRWASIFPGTRRIVRRGAIYFYGIYFWAVALPFGSFGILGLLIFPSEAWRIHWCKALLRVIWKLTGTAPEIVGVENLLNDHAQIVVANHSSYIDSPLLGSVLPGRFSFIAKKDFNSRLFKFLIQRLGAVFVERFVAASAVKDTQELIRAVQRKRNLAVFPEGTFTRASGLRAFRIGAFFAAVRSGAPIVPVSIQGTRSLLRAEWMLPRRVRAKIVISPPIWPKSDTWDEAIRLRDEARKEILEHSDEPDLGQ
jgi:1-acyl-sn-glycerol-3-phosphate acyltransferase